MWLKFIKNCETNKNGDVVWTDDNTSASVQVNGGNAVRCLGPEGDIFEDSTPEAIITQLAAEDGLSFEEEEEALRKGRKNWSREKIKKASLGNYIDAGEIRDRTLAKEIAIKIKK